MSQWISVDERLPTLGGPGAGGIQRSDEAITRTSDGYVTFGILTTDPQAGLDRFCRPRWRDRSGRIMSGITHWYPLPPEPPR